jgi:hypothetical protein
LFAGDLHDELVEHARWHDMQRREPLHVERRLYGGVVRRYGLCVHADELPAELDV